MKIVCISDTHELHRDVMVPPGDLLIHAGDITFFSKRQSVLKDFNDWLGEQPHRYKVVVPGNHDTLLESAKCRSTITNAHLIINSGLELGGFKVWGSPITPYANVAFGMPSATDRAALWSGIPAGLDILITHCPPYHVLDSGPSEAHHGGCPELRAAVIAKKPRLHVFGHIHGGYGTKPTRNTLFINAALAGELGNLDKRPVTLRMAPT